jgi:DNA-binding NarL/FixJ family response regulator
VPLAASSATGGERAWSSGQGYVMVASRNGRQPRRSYPHVVRCLIVDDNPGFLHSARTLLEQEGIQVVGVASTGAEALRRAAELHPDVTLIDIDLGGEDGFDVAQQLVDDPGIDPGHLILISTYSEDEFLDLIEASPAIGFVRKSSLSATAIDWLIRDAGDGHHGRGETPVT